MCCKGFLKIMMFIFNGGIFVAGAAILGVGVWVKVDSSSILGLLEHLDNDPSGLSQLLNISYLLIAVGGVLVVIGFLGCCGAIKESKCMLLTFFIIMLIIFLIEVAGAVVLLVFQGFADKLFESLGQEVVKSIRKGYGDNEALTSLWNATMEEFECCGYMNYTDFDDSPYYKQHGGKFYPSMCCNGTSIEDDGDMCSADTAQHPMVVGCLGKLMDLIVDNAMIIAAVALGIAALEIAAMVVSMVIYKGIDK